MRSKGKVGGGGGRGRGQQEVGYWVGVEGSKGRLGKFISWETEKDGSQWGEVVAIPPRFDGSACMGGGAYQWVCGYVGACTGMYSTQVPTALACMAWPCVLQHPFPSCWCHQFSPSPPFPLGWDAFTPAARFRCRRSRP